MFYRQFYLELRLHVGEGSKIRAGNKAEPNVSKRGPCLGLLALPLGVYLVAAGKAKWEDWLKLITRKA
jgi:hypothetical protein